MKTIFVGALLICLFACSKDDKIKPDTPDVLPVTESIQKIDAVYGTDNAEKMDYYLPANRSAATTKVILLLHGGAWADGDKSGNDDPYFKTLFDSIRLKYTDWAIFNINYRLATVSGKNIFPDQEEDVKLAVKFIYDNRQQFGISDNWVLMGQSAGAHLAMLQAYKNSTFIKPKAVVDFYGPTDIVALYNWSDAITQTGLKILLSGTPSNNASMYSNSSPINFVTAQSPPTLILQGGKDDVVPESQSLALRDKLKVAGVTTVYGDHPYFAAQTHGWSDPAVWLITMNLIKDFLTANVP